MDNILSLSQKYSTGELPLNSKVGQTSSSVTNNILLPPAQIDANTFGTFSNGYQPKGISGHGTLSKTGQKTKVDTGRYEYNDKLKTNTKVLQEQNIWQAEDGTQWIWNGKTNEYKQYNGSNKKDSKDGVNFVESNEDNVFERADEAVKQDQQRKKMSGIRESKKIFKEPEAFDDGYQVGDVTKTILGTAEDAVVDIGKGSVQLGQGIGKHLAYGVAQIADWAGHDEYADKVRNKIKNNPNPLISKVEDFQEKTVDRNSLLANGADEVMQSIGYTGTLMGVNTFGGEALNNLTMYLSSSGDSISETLQEHPNAKNWQVWLRSSASGGVSVFTESLGGILGKNKVFGNLEDKAYRKLTSEMLDGAGKVLTRLGIDATSEAVEEFIEYAGDQLVDLGMDGISYLVGSDEKFKKDWDWKEVGESMAMAFASTMLLNSSINAVSIANIKAKYKNNGQNISTKDAINILSKQTDINSGVQPNNEAQLQGLQQELTKAQEEYKNTEARREKEIIKAKIENYQNEINEILDNINKGSELNLNDLNNQEQQISLYRYEKSDNSKVDTFRKDLVNYRYDNSESTKGFINAVEKVIQDKEYTVRLNDTLGENINGKIEKKNGETIITLNPKSDYAGTFVLAHEVAHAVSTQELKELIVDYASKNSEFNEAVESLKQTYGVEDVSDEVMADIIAQNFGGDEFLNNLTTEKPNLAKRIYNKVIELLNKITGNSKENLFLKNLKNKFEEAYRNIQGSSIEEGTESYSLAGKKAKTANLEQLKEAQKLKNKGLSDEEVYRQTGWYIGNEGKWRFEIDDTNFKFEDNLKENTKYWLDNVFDAKELYDAYPQLKGIDVKFIDLPSNISGGYYEVANSIILNKDLLNNITDKEAKKTILHEIQHAIQGYEDFTKGSNGVDWEEAKRKLNVKLTELNDKLEYYHNENGFYDYQEKLVNDMDKYTIDEFFNLLEQYDINSQYADQINELKIKINKIESEYSKIKNRTSEDLYKNTGGEQEAKNVEERTELSPEQRKQILPFTKDEKTVYPVDKTLVYEYNGNKYQISLKGDIQNGEDFVYINDSNKRLENQRNESNRYKSNGAEQRNTNDRKNKRIAEQKGNINKGQTISDNKRSESKNIKNSNKSSFSLQEINKQVEKISDKNIDKKLPRGTVPFGKLKKF